MTTFRKPLFLLPALLLGLGAGALAQGPGEVSVRILDEPIDDLRSYSDAVLSGAAGTAPTEPMNVVAGRSNATSDVLLLPYYEADRRDYAGVSTMFAIRNETAREVPVRILYLTVVGAVEQQVQEITLAPNATRTINLRDVPGLAADADGVARGLVVLGAIGTSADSSDLLSGDFFFVDPATGYATGNTLLNMSLDDSGNEFCAEWGTRYLRGGGFAGSSVFRFVVDEPAGAREIDPPTAVGTVYDEAGNAIQSFEIRTDSYTFDLSSAELAPEAVPSGSLSVRFPATRGAVLVEHSGFETLSIAFKAACRDSVE
jgi:hypothetical protein